MIKASFLNIQRPLLTVMVNETTCNGDRAIIANALYHGAEAFCIQLELLQPAERTTDKLKELFDACEGKPIYITAYRAGMDDNECAELLMRGLQAGATLCDVMGDLYHPEPHELTYDKLAVTKQMALIDMIRERGGEVLMSSHLHAYLEPEQVMEYALAQQARGADIVKIVSEAHTEEQMMANINLAYRMKCELKRPFLFLNSGKYGSLLRQIGPAFGVCMYLCADSYGNRPLGVQPPLHALKAIRDNMHL